MNDRASPAALDPFALSDASEDAVTAARTAHWVRRCESCGSRGPRHFELPHPDARAAEGGATVACPLGDADDDEPRCSYCDGEFGPGSDGDRCGDCVERAQTVPSPDEGGLRAGSAALLGLCVCDGPYGPDDATRCVTCGGEL